MVVVIIIILVVIVISRGGANKSADDDDDDDTDVYIVSKTPKDDVEAQVTEAPKQSPEEEEQKIEEHPTAGKDPYASSIPGEIEMQNMTAATE